MFLGELAASLFFHHRQQPIQTLHNLPFLTLDLAYHLGHALLADHGLEVEGLVLASGEVPAAGLYTIGVEQAADELLSSARSSNRVAWEHESPRWPPNGGCLAVAAFD